MYRKKGKFGWRVRLGGKRKGNSEVRKVHEEPSWPAKERYMEKGHKDKEEGKIKCETRKKKNYKKD